MFLTIVLLSLTSGSLTLTTSPISRPLNDAGTYPHNAASLHRLPFPRDVCISPSPQRSIWDIIWSCLATLFLCSWVSVHPDVPGHREKWRQSFLRRIEYMFWTLVTPEMIICWAARQWVGARKIHQEQKARGWTVAHGHFIQMGGFMLFRGQKRQGTLSYNRFRELLREDRIEFPNVSLEEIEDKSKSDGLSKTLVFGQTSWFVLQCIARISQNLPITVLELETLAFAALNGLMCFFWWNKPFGVQCPLPVYLITPTDPSRKSTTTTTSTDLTVNNSVTGFYNATAPTSKAFAEYTNTPSQTFTPSNKTPHYFLHRFCWKKFITWPWNFILFICYRLRAMNEDEGINHAFDALDLNAEDDKQGPMRVPIFYSQLGTGHWSYLCVPLAGCLYGAIHCAAWYLPFPTFKELWLWRVSSVTIATVPVAMFLLVLLAELLKATGIVDYCISLLVFFGLAIYLMARLIILVESISTLRNLPSGTFDIVQWTSFLPHI